MSTSPSWFDQDKFSRLVKKVGPKGPSSGPLPVAGGRTPPPPTPEKETRRLQRSIENTGRASSPSEPRPDPEAPAPVRAPTSFLGGVDTVIRAAPRDPSAKESEPSTSNFPPPMPVPEPRSVSPLSRRTTPLPNLNPIFEYEKPAAGPLTSKSQPLPGRPQLVPVPPPPEPKTEETSLPQSEVEKKEFKFQVPELPVFPEIGTASERLSATWPTFPSSPESAGVEESAKPGNQTEEITRLTKERDDLTARVEELARAASELSAARAETALLRLQLQQADEILGATGTAGGGDFEELSRTIEERDGARRDYATLREEFENLKQEQMRQRATPGAKFGASEDGETLSAASAEQAEQMDALKEQVTGLENTVAALKRESDAMQKQIGQSRDETSVAQRGLALSQKALQETRDALREANENLSQIRAQMENLKSENSSLVQQNMTLQTQTDQIARDLGAARSKLARS